MCQIIYLNGPSSVGKTTLAKALQERFEKPYLHVGIDKIIDFMPEKLNDWTGKFASLGFSWVPTKDPTGHLVQSIHAGPFAKKMTRTLKEITKLLASEGYHLIIDDVAFEVTDVEEWKKMLQGFSVLYVGVVAPLEILEQREKARGDRMLGSARGQYFCVHHNVTYDLEIDTYTHTLEENLIKIEEAIIKKGTS